MRPGAASAAATGAASRAGRTTAGPRLDSMRAADRVVLAAAAREAVCRVGQSASGVERGVVELGRPAGLRVASRLRSSGRAGLRWSRGQRASGRQPGLVESPKNSAQRPQPAPGSHDGGNERRAAGRGSGMRTAASARIRWRSASGAGGRRRRAAVHGRSGVRITAAGRTSDAGPCAARRLRSVSRTGGPSPSAERGVARKPLGGRPRRGGHRGLAPEHRAGVVACPVVDAGARLARRGDVQVAVRQGQDACGSPASSLAEPGRCAHAAGSASDGAGSWGAASAGRPRGRRPRRRSRPRRAAHDAAAAGCRRARSGEARAARGRAPR